MHRNVVEIRIVVCGKMLMRDRQPPIGETGGGGDACSFKRYQLFRWVLDGYAIDDDILIPRTTLLRSFRSGGWGFRSRLTRVVLTLRG